MSESMRDRANRPTIHTHLGETEEEPDAADEPQHVTSVLLNDVRARGAGRQRLFVKAALGGGGGGNMRKRNSLVKLGIELKDETQPTPTAAQVPLGLTWENPQQLRVFSTSA